MKSYPIPPGGSRRRLRATAARQDRQQLLPAPSPLPKCLLPEARGREVSRLRASLRRPPARQPSLS